MWGLSVRRQTQHGLRPGVWARGSRLPTELYVTPGASGGGPKAFTRAQVPGGCSVEGAVPSIRTVTAPTSDERPVSSFTGQL